MATSRELKALPSAPKLSNDLSLSSHFCYITAAVFLLQATVSIAEPSCDFSGPVECDSTIQSQLISRAMAQMQIPFESPEAHGAVGDGRHDDSKALQKALNVGPPVKLTSGRVYLITKSLLLRSGATLYSENGDATIRMAKAGFKFKDYDWTKFYNDDHSIGIKINDAQNVSLLRFHLDSEDRSGATAAAIHIGRSENVVIDQLDISDLGMAPGIVMIRSSMSVVLANNRIRSSHSTASIEKDCNDRGSKDDDESETHRKFCRQFHQITGIVVDDNQYERQPGETIASRNVYVMGNLIYDLAILSSGGSEQADGITWGGGKVSSCLLIERNKIFGVGEAMDLQVGGIMVRRNFIHGRDASIKLVHGMQASAILDNTIVSDATYGAILLGSVEKSKDHPDDDEKERVHEVLIENNVFDRHAQADKPSIVFERSQGDRTVEPRNICVRSNIFLEPKCEKEIACLGVCKEESNIFVKRQGLLCTK